MSTRGRIRTQRLFATLALAALAIGLVSGCAMRPVPAYQREHLVDPIMSFKAQSRKDARLTKSFEAREGSTGGNGGEGGGCACN